MNYTIFGESHGPAIGVVLEDLPSGIPMDMDFIAAELRRRATGNSPLSTPGRKPIRLRCSPASLKEKQPVRPSA